MKTSGSRKIAERYVSALFDTAIAAHALDTVERDLRTLGELLEENQDMRDFLHNPLLTRAAQAQILTPLLAALGTHTITAQFLRVLAQRKRLDILADIIALFLTQAAQARGELAARLVSAQKLSAADAKAVAATLSKAFNKKILLSTGVNASLLGGMVINIGSTQLDASLSGKLNRLKAAMKAA